MNPRGHKELDTIERLTHTGDQLVVYKVPSSCQPKTETEKFTFKTNSDAFVLQILRRRIIRR